MPKTPAKSAAWNRGAYLVNGAAHCGACHSPSNLFGADKGPLTGAVLQGWYAPDLTSDRNAGLGRWSARGHRGLSADGPECPFHRLGPDGGSGGKFHLADERCATCNAIAVYLKDLPARRGNGGAATGVEAQMRAGRDGYDINCAACHGRDGKGNTLFPPLAGNPNVLQVRDDTIARVVLAGARAVATDQGADGPGHAQPGLEAQQPAGGGHPHLCPQHLGQCRACGFAGDGGADSRRATQRQLASAVKRFEVARQARCIEQDAMSRGWRPGARAKLCSRAGSRARVQRRCFIIRRRFRDQFRQVQRASSRLAPTRPAKAVPRWVSTGRPAHSASQPVAWAL